MTRNNILIISNAALCPEDSNGRNLSRLLDGVQKESKAQFYVYGNPNFSEGSRFYQVSDKDALNSFFKREKKNGTVNNFNQTADSISKNNKKRKKTPLKMLLREVAWKYGCWKNRYLEQWLDEVNPKVILVVAGDNSFTLNFARKIAKERKIPIILYSTEEYPFKNYNYVTKRFSLFYVLWLKKLRRSYKKIEKYVSIGIFNTEALAQAYQSEYSYPCRTIYQASDIDWVDNYEIRKPITVSYLGNLGLNRHKALIELAEELGSIDPQLKLDIYGHADGVIKKELQDCPFINLKGFVAYNEVVKIIHQSTLLVHAEYRDDFYTRDLKYAFSTKITDSVCSGTPFLLYAPEELAETQFLKEKNCAFVASDKKELKKQLELALFNCDERKKIAAYANSVKDKYFKNSKQFKNELEAILNESSSS